MDTRGRGRRDEGEPQEGTKGAHGVVAEASRVSRDMNEDSIHHRSLARNATLHEDAHRGIVSVASTRNAGVDRERSTISGGKGISSGVRLSVSRRGSGSRRRRGTTSGVTGLDVGEGAGRPGAMVHAGVDESSELGDRARGVRRRVGVVLFTKTEATKVVAGLRVLLLLTVVLLVDGREHGVVPLSLVWGDRTETSESEGGVRLSAHVVGSVTVDAGVVGGMALEESGAGVKDHGVVVHRSLAGDGNRHRERRDAVDAALGSGAHARNLAVAGLIVFLIEAAVHAVSTNVVGEGALGAHHHVAHARGGVHPEALLDNLEGTALLL